MHDNMTKSEQLKWVFKETGRQLAAVPGVLWEATVDAVNAPYELIHEIEYKFAVRKLRNEKIRNLLENLSDNTLLDRIINTHEIEVKSDDRPYEIPVVIKSRRLQLIQDIR